MPSDRDNALADASGFVRNRLVTFKKDMTICLRTHKDLPDHAGESSAFMPGLITCMGMMELIACLKHGKLDLKGERSNAILSLRADYLPQPCYATPNLEILYTGFRHKIAHTGQPNAVYVHGKGQLRVTFKISNVRLGPALILHAISGHVVQVVSWRPPFNSMMDVNLAALFSDLLGSAEAMVTNFAADSNLLTNAMQAIRECYPPG